MNTRLAATILAIALLFTGCSSSTNDDDATSLTATAPVTTDAAPIVEKPEAPALTPNATTVTPEVPADLSAEDLRFVQVLALQMTLEDSGQKQELCDAYLILGADLTASQINSEVELESRFPVDVVAEVFDENC